MNYGKWIDDIKEINKPGKYSINKIGNEANNSYIIKSPNSDKEYFVVEYRKREGKYDLNLYGEGLLVYRINTAFAGKGNMYGADIGGTGTGGDEVYLYRPNGSLNNIGDIIKAPLGYNRSSIDSKELFLSNGKDSGISLKNISTLGDTANFDVVINGQTGDDETGGTEDKDIKEWKAGTSYKVGDIVTYKNYKYKCIQAHNSVVTWEPSETPAIWERIN